MTLWRILEFIQAHWGGDITSESDCLWMGRQVKQVEQNLSTMDCILDLFKRYLHNIRGRSIIFCPKLSNQVAHVLAKL